MSYCPPRCYKCGFNSPSFAPSAACTSAAQLLPFRPAPEVEVLTTAGVAGPGMAVLPGDADAPLRQQATRPVGRNDPAGYLNEHAATAPLLPTTTSVLGLHFQFRPAMQSMSSGLRTQAGRALHRPPGVPPGGSRSLHMPSWIPRAPPPPRSSGSSVAAFFRQARNVVSRVVGELTAPALNLAGHTPHAPGPSYSSNPFRLQTIQQRLNGPTRVTLSRPFSAPYMPRGPTVPRNVTQVGLGTARNFSSAQPLFQNLAQNVPVAGRALYEADWEIKWREEKEKLRMKKYSSGKENSVARTQSIEPVRLQTPSTTAPSPADNVATTQAELDHYFPAAVVPQVTTVLLIPLAPTPTARYPLSDSPSMHSSNHPLIPFAYISAVRDDHGVHTLRVSSLFARLDTARVFEEPGVSRSAYGHPSGLCTILEVKFSGWTEAQVRAVLGEAGTGWCVLHEIRESDDDAAAMDEALSEMSFGTSTPPEHASAAAPAMDPSVSFILPTLDFSASFAAERDSWARARLPSYTGHTSPIATTSASELGFHDMWMPPPSPGGSAGSFELEDHADMSESFSFGSASRVGSPLLPTSSNHLPARDGWTSVTFSSTFSERMSDVGEDTEPREAVF